MNNINTVMANMPTKIRAYTVANQDNTYTVVLNSNLTFEQNKASYKHELYHINNGDYDDNRRIERLEIYAHGLHKII